jgi:quinoprotein glucose dehydrogenase
MFTPGALSRPEGPIATLTLATAGGGSNWPGGSYDPETHTVFVSSQASVTQIGLIPGIPGRTDMNFQSGTVQPARAPVPNIVPTPATAAQGDGAPAPAAGRGGPGGGGLTVQGLPLIKPPYGTISAIDLSKGDMLWQVPHGDTPDNIKNNPALKGLNIPRTGRTGTAGQLVTRTLVVVGEKGVVTLPNGQKGAMLRAYDKATGKDAGAVPMPAPQTGSPMTYSLNGRQYIVVAIASPDYSAELRAYRVPAN